MHISVIVPIYGVEKYIKQSLTSLFSQTKVDNVEFILVNDCTRDNSMNIARDLLMQYSEINVVLIDLEENKGVAAARQSGLAVANGDYVIQFDPDDWCEPSMLEDLYNCAIHNNADIVICDYYKSVSNNLIYQNQYTKNNIGLKCIKDMYMRRFNYGVWNKLIKRSLYIDNNISIIHNINMAEDLIFCSKVLCYAQNVVCLHKAYLHYIQNSNSLTAKFKTSENTREILLAGMHELERFYKERGFNEIINNSLNYRKVTLKYQLLMGVEKSQQKEYSKLYPEATNYIFKQTALPFIKRIILFLATKGIFFPLNITKAIKNAR